MMEAAVDAIRKDGFAILPNYLSDGAVAALREDFHKLLYEEPNVLGRSPLENGMEAQVGSLKQYPSEKYQAMRGLTSDPVIRAIVLRYYASFYNAMRPEEVKLHQQLDLQENVRPGSTHASDWHFDRMPSLKCAFLLDDTCSENGATRFMQGSNHETRQISESSLSKNNDPLWIDNYVRETDKYPIVSADAPAGSVIIFETQCVHGGGVVRAGRRRVVLLVTWPPCLNRQYLKPCSSPPQGGEPLQVFYPFDRTGQKITNPAHLFTTREL